MKKENTSSNKLTLRAVNRTSGDAFYEKDGTLYFVRPPNYLFKTIVDESDLRRAIESQEFDPPTHMEMNGYFDIESLAHHLSQPLAKMTDDTYSTAMSIFVKCMAIESWRKHLKRTRHDRANSHLRSFLLVGIKKLLTFATLSPTARIELEQWHKELEDQVTIKSNRDATEILRNKDFYPSEEKTVSVDKIYKENVYAFQQEEPGE